MKSWVRRLTAKHVDAGELEKTREELTRTKRQLRNARQRLRVMARDYLLLKMPRKSACAEIGVDEGDFSQQILQTSEPEKLYLIDAWRHPDEKSGMAAKYRKVRDRFAGPIDEGRVEIRRLSPNEAASRFEDDSLDWIYLNDVLPYEHVRQDLELFYPKLRPGGYLCGDGYGVEDQWHGGVRRAVDEFAEERGLRLEVKVTQFMARKPDLSDLSTRGSLPDVLVIGTQKGGTTSLYDGVLRRHSYFQAAAEKEIHYFDTPKFKKGEEWYRSNFPLPAWKNGRRILTGEASPYYMFHPHVARRVADAVPHARLVVMLRNPVDRAFSDYQDRVRQGMEELGFEEALEAEDVRLRGEMEKMLADEDYVSRSYRRHAYLSRGIYVDQFVEWHGYFAEDQLLVLKSEDFFEDPEATAKLVFDFLDLPEQKIKLEKTLNKGTYAPMNPGTRQHLEAYFEPHNRRLYEYLGRDFGW